MALVGFRRNELIGAKYFPSNLLAFVIEIGAISDCDVQVKMAPTIDRLSTVIATDNHSVLIHFSIARNAQSLVYIGQLNSDGNSYAKPNLVLDRIYEEFLINITSQIWFCNSQIPPPKIV